MRKLIAFMLLIPMLVACNGTPRQRYNGAVIAYDATTIGLAVYNDKKPFPSPVWDTIQSTEKTAALRLADANQWLKDNPTLADTPGSPFPPLDPFNVVLDVLLSQLHSVNGVVIIPPSPTPGPVMPPIPTTVPH